VLEYSGLVTLRKPPSAAQTLPGAEAAGNTSDVDVDLQLLGKSAGGDGLPDVPLLDVPPPDAPITDVLLADDPLPEARLDGSVGEE